MENFDSTKTNLPNMLAGIVSGKVQLPDFQRGWVWDDEHIRALLASIARKFPVGAVMMLETGGTIRFKMRPVEGVETKVVGDEVEKLILDGQQRLTSLTQVLKLKEPVKTRNSRKRPMLRHYYFDIEKALEGPEYLFEAIIGLDETKQQKANFGREVVLDLTTAEKEYESFLFPCNQILNSDEWEQGLFEKAPDKFPLFMRFRQEVLTAFRQYELPVIELKKNNSKEAVCLVFEKVNTGGVPLSVFELITASYAADGVNMRDEWYGNRREGLEGISEQLSREPLVKETSPTDFMQGLSLLHTYQLRLDDLRAGKSGKAVAAVSARRESVLSLPLAAYQHRKDSLLKGFLAAAKFLRREAFFTPRDLPYRSQVVPLACVLSLLGDAWLEKKNYEKISQWFWCGVLGELYGGAVETRIANDLQQIMSWIRDDGDEPDTVRDANFQASRLDSLRSRNSAAYKAIHVLIQREGAVDWLFKSTIRDLDANDYEESKLDIHHIFPKDWCKAQGIPPRRFNSILNKTPISYRANRMIGGKAPSEYLQQLQSAKALMVEASEMDELLRTHCLDPVSLRADDYSTFVERRRELMLSKIERAMGKAATRNEAVIEEDVDEDDEADD